MKNQIVSLLKITLLASASSASAAAAQDSTTEPTEENVIVVTGEVSTFGATKSNAPISETPRSVSVITSDDFEDRGALSLANTLNYTAGVTGNAFGLSTRGDFAAIRSLDAPEYQDNLQVQFGFYNNARADVYTLEQVEVLKGPASVLYGQAAPGGIVSTVSKVAGPDQLDKELVITGGNFGRYQLSTDLGIELSGDGMVTARLVGILRDSGTEVDFVQDDAFVIAPSVTFDNGTTRLTGLFNYTDRDSNASAQFLPLSVTACQSDDVAFSDPNFCANAPAQGVDNGTFVDDPSFSRYDTESITGSIFLTHEFSDALSFEGTARYRDNEADYQQSWASFLGDGNPRVAPDGSFVARSILADTAGTDQFGLDARLRGNFTTGPIEHEVLAGVTLQQVDATGNRAFLYAQPTTFNILAPVYDGAGFPTASQIDAQRAASENSTDSTDFYIVDRMTIGNLIVDAGIRYSSVDSEDGTTQQEDEEYPITLGALYKTGFGLNPYVSFAQSFRATVGTDINTNSPLLPRRGEQIEAGIKYQPDGSRIYVAVAYYDLEEDNLVDFVAGGQTQPGLTIQAKGLEVEAIVGVGDFTFDFDFRHQDAEEVDENGVALPRPSDPDTTLALWGLWEPTSEALSGFRVGAGVRYASQNESNGTAFLAANGFAPTANRVVTNGYTIFDGMIGYEFDSGVSLSLNARNLFDKQYFATCLSRGDCFPGEQRTVVGSVGFRF